MRLFYDEYSSRLKGEVLLLVADTAALCSAVLFATGAIHRGSRPGDVALLVVWASIPRALANVVGQAGRLSRGWRATFGSGALFVLTALLLLSGWELVSSAPPPQAPIEPSTEALLLLAWGSGFLLFHARAYRLHDFLLWSAMLLGLKDSRPHALAWLPAFFAAALLSAALRHLIHDAFRDSRRARLNLQNARVSALLAAAAAFLIFVGAYAGLHGGLDFSPPMRGPATGGPSKLSVELAEGDAGPVRRTRQPSVGSAQGIGEALAGRTQPADRIVGFTYRVALRDLSLARFDPREVLRVRAKGNGGETWRPSSSTQWKAVSFSRFNPEDESWSEETDYVRSPWPTDHRLARKLPALSSAAAPVTLDVRVVRPVCRNAVLPYFTSSISSRDWTQYRESGLGDVFPYPSPARGARYSVDVVQVTSDFVPQTDSRGAHEDARHLEIPTAGDAGLDLRALARKIVENRAETAQAKLRRLNAYFARELRYSQNAVWKSGRNPLASFLLREKTGNCTYFATAAALLLRATGVSTRLVVGFLGGEWDEANQEAVIRNQTAHAWIEVYFPGNGWYPVDATAWSPVDASFQTPPDAADAVREALESTRPSPRDDELADTARASRSQPSMEADSSTADRGARPSDEDREGTDKLPEGTTHESEEEGMWIEYAGEIDAGKSKRAPPSDPDALPDLAEVPEGIPHLGETPHTPGAGAAEDLAQAERPKDLADGESPRTRAALRFAVATAGAVVIVLLVASFLRRSSTPEDEEEKPIEDAAAEAAAVAAGTLSGLDETVPSGRVVAEYIRLQQALERTRSHRLPHQTPLEHARAVAGRREVDEAFFDLHRVLYRLLYGGEPIDWNHADAVVKSCKKLRRALG